MAKHFAADDLVIEIDMPKGERYNFRPSPNEYGPERFLRSRHALDKLTPGSRSHLGKLATLPELPGQHVVLNVAKRYGKVIDPMGWDENAELLAKVEALKAASPIRALGATRTKAIRGREVKLSPRAVATWLYHMRRAVARYTIRPAEQNEEPFEVSCARVVQDPDGLLTCGVEKVMEKIAEWPEATVDFLKSGNRQAPRTVEEMRHYAAGDWDTYREQRAIERIVAEGKKA